MTILRVALDVPLPTLFDYLAEEASDRATPGMRVLVPFGRRRLVGVVVEVVARSAIDSGRLKQAQRLLDDTPALSSEWLRLAEFTSRYYHSPIGEVVLSALPPRLRRAEPLRVPVTFWALTAPGQARLHAPAIARGRVRQSILRALEHGPAPTEALTGLAPSAAAALRALHEEGLIESAPEPTREGGPRFVDSIRPTPAQSAAVQAIDAEADRFAAFLLFGITGSGKTEVYLRAIRGALERGRQALVLVPEINLTPQLAEEFRARFPDTSIAVLHSGVAENERAAAWLGAQSGRVSIVLGTRLALFTPFRALGLIVVDEEHDSSFKQQDGVRYSARDLAVMRAKLAGIPVVLGSATPALESLANAQEGAYRLLALPERARAGASLPPIRLIDLRSAPAEQGVAVELIDAVRDRMARREQSLLFLNRRGYAPVLACGACGWIADCTRCAAHLVLHYGNAVARDHPRPATLRCHHCGDASPPPRACPTCGNVDLAPFGRGTQRLEDTVQALFPQARILRIDSDSIRSKTGWSAMRAAIDAGTVDILVGTQILAKGHDFTRLTLVGALHVDATLLAADYRAPERLFAQLQQVAGRAGRASLPGEVLIQTRYPEAPLFAALVQNDYEGFATRLIAERAAAGFPPSIAEAVLRAEARDIGRALGFLNRAVALAPGRTDGVHLFDPVPMSLSKLAGWERAHVLVQCPERRSLQRFLAQWVARLREGRTPKSTRWHVDVDPIDF